MLVAPCTENAKEFLGARDSADPFFLVLERYKDNGKENGNYRVWGLGMGIMEKKMETTTVNRGSLGIMEKKLETTSIDKHPANLWAFTCPTL